MDFIGELHEVISRSTMLFFLLIGVWGTYRAFRRYEVDGSYFGALVIAEGLFIVQAIVGVILIIGGAMPGRTIHFLYGAFGLVALPGLFAYIKGDDSNRAQWYYAIMTLFLFGVALRSIGTG